MEVFISHGFAHDDQPGKDFLLRLQSALSVPADGLAAFLDQKGLLPGYAWRSELHEALARCGAGVIVLSERAITRDWVHKEAAILSWRRALQTMPGFRLHVVIFDGIDEDTLERAGLGPMQLTEIQAQRCKWDEADIARVVDRIRDDLCALARSVALRADWTPLDRLREFLAMRLATIPQPVKLHELALEIDGRGPALPIGPSVVNDCAELIAAALLRDHFDTPGRLAQFMDRLNRLAVAHEHRSAIFGVVASLWVDPQRARTFHPRFDPTPGERTAFIGLLTDAPSPALWEARMLAERASPRPAVSRVISIASPKHPENLVREITSKLIEKFGNALRDEDYGDDTDDAQVLRQLAKNDAPIYVVMKFELDEQQIEELFERLPGFLYVGMRFEQPPRRGDSRWRRVEPRLASEELDQRHQEHRDIRDAMASEQGAP